MPCTHKQCTLLLSLITETPLLHQHAQMIINLQPLGWVDRTEDDLIYFKHPENPYTAFNNKDCLVAWRHRELVHAWQDIWEQQTCHPCTFVFMLFALLMVTACLTAELTVSSSFSFSQSWMEVQQCHPRIFKVQVMHKLMHNLRYICSLWTQLHNFSRWTLWHAFAHEARPSFEMATWSGFLVSHPCITACYLHLSGLLSCLLCLLWSVTPNATSEFVGVVWRGHDGTWLKIVITMLK